MKKKIISGLSTVLLFLVMLIFIIFYLYAFDSGSKVDAQEENDIYRKMLAELQKERQLLEAKRKKLEEYERNLKAFEADLEQKNNEYLQKAKELEEKTKAFNKQVQDKVVNRQAIETYENIDPAQAAVLMKNLYGKDAELAVLIMRRISGRKAGKILEAMIPLDSEMSAKLAKEALDYYKPH